MVNKIDFLTRLVEKSKGKPLTPADVKNQKGEEPQPKPAEVKKIPRKQVHVQPPVDKPSVPEVPPAAAPQGAPQAEAPKPGPGSNPAAEGPPPNPTAARGNAHTTNQPVQGVKKAGPKADTTPKDPQGRAPKIVPVFAAQQERMRQGIPEPPVEVSGKAAKTTTPVGPNTVPASQRLSKVAGGALRGFNKGFYQGIAGRHGLAASINKLGNQAVKFTQSLTKHKKY